MKDFGRVFTFSRKCNKTQQLCELRKLSSLSRNKAEAVEYDPISGESLIRGVKDE
jgi:hypothetical protein